MDYVVGYNKKHLKLGSNDFRKSGEPVPEANKWPEHVLRAHVSLKWLMTPNEYEMAVENSKLTKRPKRKYTETHAKPAGEKVGGSKVEVSIEETASTEGVEDVYESLSKKDLQELCRERELPVRGTKKEMVERLRSQ